MDTYILIFLVIMSLVQAIGTMVVILHVDDLYYELLKFAPQTPAVNSSILPYVVRAKCGTNDNTDADLKG